MDYKIIVPETTINENNEDDEEYSNPKNLLFQKIKIVIYLLVPKRKIH